MIEGLHEHERIDNLMDDETNGLEIIQSREVFSFSMDAVLLARWGRLPRSGKVADLCCGNGVVALLLSDRTDLPITAVELQPQLADMARRSVMLNKLEHQVDVVEQDIRVWAKSAGHGRYTAVWINPPYMALQAGMHNMKATVANARHELNGELEELLRACARALQTGGRTYCIHRASRMIDVVTAMRACRLEPKRIKLIHPRAGLTANLVLIEAMKDGGTELHVEPPLMIYTPDGKAYTPELMAIYFNQDTARGGGFNDKN